MLIQSPPLGVSEVSMKPAAKPFVPKLTAKAPVPEGPVETAVVIKPALVHPPGRLRKVKAIVSDTFRHGAFRATIVEGKTYEFINEIADWLISSGRCV